MLAHIITMRISGRHVTVHNRRLHLLLLWLRLMLLLLLLLLGGCREMHHLLLAGVVKLWR